MTNRGKLCKARRILRGNEPHAKWVIEQPPGNNTTDAARPMAYAIVEALEILDELLGSWGQPTK